MPIPVKPTKWKGTPEMREDAEGVWEEFLELCENIDQYSAQELSVFHLSNYMQVGHANLGRMYVALAKAMATEPA